MPWSLGHRCTNCNIWSELPLTQTKEKRGVNDSIWGDSEGGQISWAFNSLLPAHVSCHVVLYPSFVRSNGNTVRKKRKTIFNRILVIFLWQKMSILCITCMCHWIMFCCCKIAKIIIKKCNLIVTHCLNLPFICGLLKVNCMVTHCWVKYNFICCVKLEQKGNIWPS